MLVDLRVPELAESVTEAAICTLNVAEGDRVEVDQIVCEVETDKVVFEIPATEAGTVRNLRVKTGQQVKSEELLLQIELPVKDPASPGSHRFPNSSKTPLLEGLDQKVFVVHGHDEVALQQVARTIERIGLEAVVLHEQMSRGMTIIEKFEHFARNAGFAVVLMTPDDLGGKTPKSLARRARQNVVLELGFFTGLLGRHRVFVLTKDYVEIPSDYLGVVYTSMDSAGGWKLSLAKELKRAGMKLDESKILSM
jgi:predicted nucleotide-binding protein